ncbi:MAG: hypothetical protein P1V35_07140 [Planctomycetota bacterium]|nr:hypothetical protein [Planctomycetota bacterium]
MSTHRSKVAPPKSISMAGQELRAQAEALGAELQDGFSELIASLPRRILGPQALSDTLEGINVVSSSRLLKALAQKDPIATLQLLPGPKPLLRMVDAAKKVGSGESATDRAEKATGEFDRFIRDQAGDRSALKAMLSAWLPEERKEFESQRRQTIFRARQELDGVSSELEMNTMVLHPSSDAGFIDLVNVKCLFGIDRIRPDAIVKLGTRLVSETLDGEGIDPQEGVQRLPTTLDGEVADNGLHSVLLNEFCSERIAPLEVHRHGLSVDYSLGPTGFGRASKVDLVMAEVNRKGLESAKPLTEHAPHFWVVPEMCVRKLVFDLLLHEDVYAGSSPHLKFYNTNGHGPAVAGDPHRELDRREFTHSIEVIGKDLRRLRLMEFPTYGDLKAKIFDKLDWDPSKFRAYRVAITYPLTGIQVSLSFNPSEEDDSSGQTS